MTRSIVVKNSGDSFVVKKSGDVGTRRLPLDLFYQEDIEWRDLITYAQKILANEIVICPFCGGTNVVKAGIRYCKHDTKQRYLCKDCKRKFTLSTVFRIANLPINLVAIIVSKLARGYSSRDISKDLFEHHGVRVSPSTIIRIGCKVAQLLNEMETLILKHFKSAFKRPMTWYIDDTFRKVRKKRLKGRKRGEARRYFHIIAILDEETRYCLALVVSRKRDAEAFKRSLGKALKLTGGTRPSLIKSDSYAAQIEAIKVLMSDVQVDSKSKSEDFSHINLIESFFSGIRKALCKQSYYSSIINLQCRADLIRHWHNFLKSFGGRTPAEALGIILPVLVIEDSARGFETLVKLAIALKLAEIRLNKERERERKKKQTRGLLRWMCV